MIMQGFVGFRIPVLVRRLVTMVPAFIVVGLGVNATNALVISQVVLSIALPIPMIALLLFTQRPDIMGPFVNGRVTRVAAIAGTAVVTAFLTLILLLQTFGVPVPFLKDRTEPPASDAGSKSMALLHQIDRFASDLYGPGLVHPQDSSLGPPMPPPRILTAPEAATPAPAPDKSEYSLLNPTPDDQMRAFTPERPTLALVPFTVDAGHFQYESDLFNYTHTNYLRTGTISYLTADPTVKLGLTNWIDFEVELQRLPEHGDT